jgi:hypothetical protein
MCLYSMITPSVAAFSLPNSVAISFIPTFIHVSDFMTEFPGTVAARWSLLIFDMR